MAMLDDTERARYDRQMRLPDFGEDGQRRLKKAKVFIAGVGGLGSPVAAYLAIAGVGNIRIIDHDIVENTNLNRQILHWTSDVGKTKTASAKEKLDQINPHVNIDAISDEIRTDNAHRLVGDAGIIIDALDNFSARYALNRVAIDKKIPYVHGSVYGLEGRLTFIMPGETPCLKCIFPKPPPEGIVPVVGTTPGVIGCMQAAETIKYFTGIGTLAKNKLIVYDGMHAEIIEIPVKRDSNCPECLTGNRR